MFILAQIVRVLPLDLEIRYLSNVTDSLLFMVRCNEPVRFE